MKRIAMFLIVGSFFVTLARAEDMPADKPADAATTETTATAVVPPAEPSEAPAAPMAPATPAEPAAAEVAPAVPPAAVDKAENLEFVSGEVSAMDEASKSLTVKLYGETENAPSDKTLKVTVDSTTDITDGEQDRDLKSLTAGTEVDVEYDPATSKATYIFVY